MHLVEHYALACGVKIGRPYIATAYYPVVYDKYITIHAGSDADARKYDYFEVVLFMLEPYLKEHGYTVIQIGKGDIPLTGCVDMRDLDIKQANFVQQGSSLHLSNDTYSAHVAGALGLKQVALYSALFKTCSLPYWNVPENMILLESHRKGNKPSFSSQEQEKVINYINPEEIVKAVLKLLNIPHCLDSHKTLFFGTNFNKICYEVVPDHDFNYDLAPEDEIIIRMDYNYDHNYLLKLGSRYKNVVLTRKSIPIEVISKMAILPSMVLYRIDDGYDINFIKTLTHMGIPIRVVYTKDFPKEKITKMRVDLYDYPVVEMEKDKTFAERNLEEVETSENVWYMSNKVIFSKDKKYMSKDAYNRGEVLENIEYNVAKLSKSQDILEDMDFLYIYKV